jgi:multicomponent Na+:H+ antiporter subunit D
VLAILAASTLLNAAYFLPPVYAAWFGHRDAPWPRDAPGEGRIWLIAPALITAALTIAVGVLAFAPPSPLTWAGLIVEREYGDVVGR